MLRTLLLEKTGLTLRARPVIPIFGCLYENIQISPIKTEHHERQNGYILHLKHLEAHSLAGEGKGGGG